MNKTQKELIRLKKREELCARTPKGKALLTIDHILSNVGSDDKLLCKLYRIAHCATGVCGNPHKDWIEELESDYEANK